MGNILVLNTPNHIFIARRSQRKAEEGSRRQEERSQNSQRRTATVKRTGCIHRNLPNIAARKYLELD